MFIWLLFNKIEVVSNFLNLIFFFLIKEIVFEFKEK